MKTDPPTTDCPLCGKLRKTETSFSKYESNYPDTRFAAQSTRDAWLRLPTEGPAFIASGDPWLSGCNEPFDRELAALRVTPE